jgi:hypothetical protein
MQTKIILMLTCQLKIKNLARQANTITSKKKEAILLKKKECRGGRRSGLPADAYSWVHSKTLVELCILEASILYRWANPVSEEFERRSLVLSTGTSGHTCRYVIYKEMLRGKLQQPHHFLSSLQCKEQQQLLQSFSNERH